MTPGGGEGTVIGVTPVLYEEQTLGRVGEGEERKGDTVLTCIVKVKLRHDVFPFLLDK